MSKVYIISGAKRNSYGENPLFGGSATYMWREAPSNGHNFDVWSNFNIPAGVNFFMIIKSKMVSRGQG